jgi:uncharacterized sulfatase
MRNIFIIPLLAFGFVVTSCHAQNNENKPALDVGSEDFNKPNIIVIYTDDHGYADMAVQNVFDDLITPNVDALAQSGVRATSGYSSAPQCIPSRAGLMAGRSQNKFGVESNGLDDMDAIMGAQKLLPERLKEAGYTTAQFGKWHLGDKNRIIEHGFDYIYPQNSQGSFPANIDKNGNDRTLGMYNSGENHLIGCTMAATAMIKRLKDDPFFLYVAYRAPHVPLDPPQEYVDRIPGEMPTRRRLALAMLLAVDDGVGQIVATLEEEKLLENTIIFYIGDNGAPLKIYKEDTPCSKWDGSQNDPLNGEKGTLIEGGMRVPFVVSWKGQIPAGQIYEHPIWTLDVAATAVKLAGLSEDPSLLDGVDLMPYLSGENTAEPHEELFWRWGSQSAIRQGKYKFLKYADDEYLFNLETDISETNNIISENENIRDELYSKLKDWCDEMPEQGFKTETTTSATKYFNYYLKDKYYPPPVCPRECNNGELDSDVGEEGVDCGGPCPNACVQSEKTNKVKNIFNY